MTLEIFSTKECSKCKQLASLLSEMNVEYSKRVIDDDKEAETDALILNIRSAPVLKKGDRLLLMKDMFRDGSMVVDRIKEFIHE